MALLTLSNIHRTFEKRTVNKNHVLHGLDLNIRQGNSISVIGGNGAGKSTPMNSIAGIVDIDEGDILLEGESIRKASVTARLKDISHAFQDPRMGTATNSTIEGNMAIAYRRGKKRSLLRRSVTEQERKLFKEALTELGLKLGSRMKTDAAFLSGGQRQALTFVAATLVRPKILLLDEHTTAFDPKTNDMVAHLAEKIVEERELTTLMVTHSIEHAIEYGDRLTMLYHGKIIVDVQGDRKKNLTVAQLMDLFRENSDQALNDDALALG